MIYEKPCECRVKTGNLCQIPKPADKAIYIYLGKKWPVAVAVELNRYLKGGWGYSNIGLEMVSRYYPLERSCHSLSTK